MKIDKSNPRHWFYLVIFTLNILIGIACAFVLGKTKRKTIVLYGHKLNGNLLAIYEYAVKRKTDAEDCDIYYLTMDPVYFGDLKSKGIQAYCALKPYDICSVCRSRYIVSDHGLHSLVILKNLSVETKFIDVWHGIPFKGFDRDDFAVQRAYDAVLVASNSMKNCYIKQYGFDEEKVFVTGYARTDRLVRGDYNRNEIYRQSRLEGRGDQAYVMIAPTWSHSEYGGSDIPFNLNTAEFFGILSEVAEAEKIHFIFRSHLNSANVVNNHPKHISILSVNDYPQTEELLYISSVLVSDWSSIVFDYLVLDRPTIFIDKPDPFPKGFSYGPEYRFGDISHNVDDLLQSISFAVNHPEDYLSAHEKNMKRVRSEVYGSYADGKSASRAVKQILKIT